MTTFSRQQRSAIACGFFQNVITAPTPPQNNTTIAEEKYHRIVTQQTKSDTIQKGMLSLPILTTHIFQRI